MNSRYTFTAVSVALGFVLFLSGCVSRNGPYSFFIRDTKGFLRGPFVAGSSDDKCQEEVSRLFEAGGSMNLPHPYELETVCLLKSIRVSLDLEDVTPIDFCKALDRQLRDDRRYPPVSLNVAHGDSWGSVSDPCPPLPLVRLKLSDVSAYEALESFAAASHGKMTVDIWGLCVCVCVHGDDDHRDESCVVIWESLDPKEMQP